MFTLPGSEALNYIQGQKSFQFFSTFTFLPKRFVTRKQSPLPNSSNNIWQKKQRIRLSIQASLKGILFQWHLSLLHPENGETYY